MGKVLPQKKLSFNYFLHQNMRCASFTKFTTKIFLNISAVFEEGLSSRTMTSSLFHYWGLCISSVEMLYLRLGKKIRKLENCLLVLEKCRVEPCHCCHGDGSGRLPIDAKTVPGLVNTSCHPKRTEAYLLLSECLSIQDCYFKHFSICGLYSGQF